MSSSDSNRVTSALVTQLARVAGEAVLGVGFAVISVWGFVGCIRASSVIEKIRDAPCVDVSGLRSILLQQNDNSTAGKSGGGGEVLVFVRGTVDTLVVEKGWIKSAVEKCINSVVVRWRKWTAPKGGLLEWALERGWMDLPRNGLLSSSSGDDGIILRKTQSSFYIGSIFSARGWRQGHSFTRLVHFALKQGDQQSQSDYLVVNMTRSKHPLPLVTVHHHMQPTAATPYTFVQSLLGQDPVALLDEEKILPPGKEISAVGVCYLKDGVTEIKSCNNLPYFLSGMRKDEMIADLSVQRNGQMWSSIVFGSISIAILGYAIIRVWNIWKEGQQARRVREEVRPVEIFVEEAREVEVLVEQGEEGEVCEEQLCVVCLTRRRESAFVPCGHLVCCRSCAVLIARKMNPKCPICRQSLLSSVRIYAS